ncbi:MAG: peptide ABC transporter substrate-binding protein [Chloroflexota bacterium]|nr:peptide ABC transporter substrate-binding protein [Chloroflexota bacterium]
MKKSSQRKQIVLILLVSLVLAVYPVALSAQEPVVFRQPANEPTGLDPAQGGFGYQEFFSLYEPLVDAYSSSEITPLAAESWTLSDDGTTYTFTLREGLMWSDGAPVTAEDYRQSFLRQLNPATAAYSADEFFPIRNGQAYNAGEITDPEMVGLSAPDDLTLIIELEQPTPFFLSYLGNSSYLPVRVDLIEQYGDQWMEAGNHVGNGPYMLTQWDHDQLMVFEKNPNYNGIWKDNRFVDRIEFVIMADAWNQAVPAFEAGEVDVAIAPAGELARLLDDPEYADMINPVPIAGTIILVMDTTNTPTDDVRVRQALSLSIDRETLSTNVLRGAYAPAISLSPPQIASHNPAEAFGYQYNPELAQQLLAEAGYPGGEGFPEFEVTYWSVDRAQLEMQALQAMWSSTLGIDVNLNPLEPSAMRDWRISRNENAFNMYYGLNWAGIQDPNQFHNALFDPDNSLKRSRFADAAYIDLIRTAQVETDPAARIEMYQQAEAIINEQVPIISVDYESQTWLIRPYVQNFIESTTAVGTIFRYAQPPGLQVNR